MNNLLAAAVLAVAGLAANSGLAAPRSAADSVAHRWAVGLQFTHQRYLLPRSSGRPYDDFGPLQLTVGYQWRPRWSAEVGALYWANDVKVVSGAMTTDGRFRATINHTRWRNAALPLRVRYKLTRQATRRVQFDALSGLTLALFRHASVLTITENDVETDRYESRGSGLGVSANLGAGAQVGLDRSRRLALTADWLLNVSLRPLEPMLTDPLDSFGPRSGWALGLRYRL